ncbi:MAG TPA: zinc-binding alcohol dehydrogenase [Jiangellaceae bacterium]|nr:zinc-binding alcohol dehydrogenase [Jiangellaceae bacterium]
MDARAVFFVAPRAIEVAPVRMAEVGENDVLVRTSYSGISAGSELLAYRGQIDPAIPVDETIGALGGTFRYPFRYGYSCVGRVERGGIAFAEGDLVFAFHPHQDRFVVPTDDIIALGSLDPRVATLLPLVETALQLTRDAGPVEGEPVVVAGLGVVGLLTAALLARAGARVVASEPLEWRRTAARPFGVGAVAPDELNATVQDETGGRGAQVLIEASGNPAALASGLRLLAHEGTALVASWYGTKPVSLPLGAEFHRRRLSIRSSQVSSIPAAQQPQWTVQRRRQAARALLAELPLQALATHTFAFADAAEAFAAVDRGDDGLIHAALCY